MQDLVDEIVQRPAETTLTDPLKSGMTPPASLVAHRHENDAYDFFTAAIVLASFAMHAKTTTSARQNPLLTASPLPFQAPPFDRIKDTDYKPAIEAGMKQQLAEMKAIADDKSAPTFANTIEAMEKSGALLTRASKIFFNLTQSNTNDTFQKIEAEESPKLAAHQDAIFMNPKLYARVKSLYDKRAS